MMGTWEGLGRLLSAQGTGVIAASDIEMLFESMWDNVRETPGLLIVSEKDARRICRINALSKLYAANPLPCRRLRKCFARKRRAAINKAKRRLFRKLEIEERGGPLPFDEISSDEIAAMDFNEYDGVPQGLAEHDTASADKVMETFVREVEPRYDELYRRLAEHDKE